MKTFPLSILWYETGQILVLTKPTSIIGHFEKEEEIWTLSKHLS